VVFSIELGTRRVCMTGITVNPVSRVGGRPARTWPWCSPSVLTSSGSWCGSGREVHGQRAQMTRRQSKNRCAWSNCYPYVYAMMFARPVLTGFGPSAGRGPKCQGPLRALGQAPARW